MPQLALFWKLLETRPDRTAVISEWQRVSDDRMDSVRRLLLLHERSASTYPNPHPAGQPLFLKAMELGIAFARAPFF